VGKFSEDAQTIAKMKWGRTLRDILKQSKKNPKGIAVEPVVDLLSLLFPNISPNSGLSSNPGEMLDLGYDLTKISEVT
jgi:hypothetical protein